jgi:hypothetical protein
MCTLILPADLELMLTDILPVYTESDFLERARKPGEAWISVPETWFKSCFHQVKLSSRKRPAIGILSKT